MNIHTTLVAAETLQAEVAVSLLNLTKATAQCKCSTKLEGKYNEYSVSEDE